MRIISGYYKGRRFHPPINLPVRPTTDFAKEGLLNVLNHLVDYEATTALDLFAGTGSIAFELYSRGCPSVTAVDIEKRCVSFINDTAKELKMVGLHAIRLNFYVLIRRCTEQYDLIFADPPYSMEGIDELPQMILESTILKPEGLFILEHSERHTFQSNLFFNQVRNYGKVYFTLFRKEQKESV